MKWKQRQCGGGERKKKSRNNRRDNTRLCLRLCKCTRLCSSSVSLVPALSLRSCLNGGGWISISKRMQGEWVCSCRNMRHQCPWLTQPVTLPRPNLPLSSLRSFGSLFWEAGKHKRFTWCPTEGNVASKGRGSVAEPIKRLHGYSLAFTQSQECSYVVAKLGHNLTKCRLVMHSIVLFAY